MISTGQTKKLVAGIASQMSSLAQQLDSSAARYEAAAKRAAQILDGSSTDVEEEVAGKLKAATAAAEQAKDAVKSAAAACEDYGQSKL